MRKSGVGGDLGSYTAYIVGNWAQLRALWSLFVIGVGAVG